MNNFAITKQQIDDQIEKMAQAHYVAQRLKGSNRHPIEFFRKRAATAVLCELAVNGPQYTYEVAAESLHELIHFNHEVSTMGKRS